jgi:ABC-type Fe3+-hydroxamate transport system substrate-binding protein
MRNLLLAAAAFVLAACSPAADVASSASPECLVTASSVWQPSDSVSMNIDAVAIGPSCDKAAAMIVVRDANGVAFLESYPVEHVMVLAGADDDAAMRTSLTEWISTASPTYATSGALPDWPQGADFPMSGEFAFYVANDMTREQYLALRERNAPVFCYVQGMESMNCLSLEDGIVTSVGLQTFPG